MVILKSRVNGQDVQYSVVRVAAPAEVSGSIVPDANGPRYAAVCRKCGFGVASTFPGHAIQLLLFSVASGHDHHHSTTATHFRVDPDHDRPHLRSLPPRARSTLVRNSGHGRHRLAPRQATHSATRTPAPGRIPAFARPPYNARYPACIFPTNYRPRQHQRPRTVDLSKTS